MSWPQWSSGAQPSVPSVLNPATPVINSAPSVVPPGIQYTPDQWAQLQQQNWHQWAQWQQQYQQWHQQYGAEYQKSMNALAQAAQHPLSTLPNVAVPPPLPAEIKPPLPADDPPPPIPSYSTAPPPVQPPIQQPVQPPIQPPVQPPGYNTAPLPKTNDRPPVSYPKGNHNQNWHGGNTRYPNDMNQNKRGYDHPMEPDPKRQMLNKPGWQNQPNLHTQPPPPPVQHPIKPVKDNIEELSEAEKKFDKQFAEWEAQFNKWKEQNAEHPDKEQYKEYEKKWESWRAQLLERREQMKRKRLGLLANDSPNKGRPPLLGSTTYNQSPQQGYNSPQQGYNQSHQNYNQPSKVASTYPNMGQKPPPKSGGLLPTPQSSAPFNKPPPNLNDEPLKFKQSNKPPLPASEPEEPVDDFIKPDTSGGIPGLDLVTEDSKPQKEGEDVVDIDGDKEKKGPDFDAISKGINSILGDQKLLNMLSMVSQNQNVKMNDNLINTVSKIKDASNPDTSLQVSHQEQSNQSYEDHSNHSEAYVQREFVNNFDDQTRSSFTMAHNEQEMKYDAAGNYGRNQKFDHQQFPDRFGGRFGESENDQFNRNNFGRNEFGDRQFPPGRDSNERFPLKGDIQDRRFLPGPGRNDPVSDRFGQNNERQFGGPRGGPKEDRFGTNQDRFAPIQDRFGPGGDRFGPENDRFGSNQEKFDQDWDGPGQDRFKSNQNRFGPGQDRFGPNQDRFGPNKDRFGLNSDRFGLGQDRFGPNQDKFSSSLDRFGPGQNKFGPNRDKLGPNQDRFGPNQGRFGPNQDRFGSNQDRFGSNQDKFGPSQDKFGPNQDRSGPNQERFGQNQERFGPNKDKFGPLQDRFGPNQNRFGSNQEKFGSNQEKFGSNQEKFGPNQGRFGSNQDRFGPRNDFRQNPDEVFGSRGGPNDKPMVARGDAGPRRFDFGNDNFNRGQFDRGGFNQGPSQEDNYDENYDYPPEENYDEGVDPDLPPEDASADTPWQEDQNYEKEGINELPATDQGTAPAPSNPDILQPATVIDYDHKSLKPADPEILIEPIYMFDYRHKTISRIPLPQRPKWLTETVKNIREFDPPLVRPYEPPNLRRYPPPVDNWRKERYMDDHRPPHNRWNYNDNRPPYEERRPYGDGRPYEESKNFKKDWSPDRRREEKKFDEPKQAFQGTDYEEEKISDTEWPDDDEMEQYKEPKQDSKFPKFQKMDTGPKPNFNKGTVLIEDLIRPPGRYNRPPRIVIILRGPPGSGKTFLAKLIKDKEVENGGSTPRILSLDDYFMVEQEKEITEEGKKVTIKEMVYEYEAEMEESYRSSLMKSFKKTITDGYFSFIIVDNVNDKVKYFGEMWSFAKQNGFQVYVCQLDLDVQTCSKRNIHGRSEADIEKCVAEWEPTPAHHPVVDATSLLQSISIPEVEMEEVNSPESDVNENDGSEDQVARSKWDNFDCSIDNLAKLDGVSKPLRHSRTMEEYLQLDTDWTPSKTTKPGQKRVRWADLEEQKQQKKMRAIGFVVGHTNWNRMMDPTGGSSALTQTKYIEKTGRFKVDR